MIRSMFTAIGALNLNQTWLDVISDNLANSTTTGFKSSRVIFQDQFAQIMSSGAAPIGDVGGINPTEVGLGVKLGYVSPVFTQGMMQSTGRSTDLAIQGNGFFVYSNGQETFYSREGSLEIDADGYLVNNSTGMRIMGWMTASDGSIDTNAPVSTMQISLDATVARATTTASIGGNLDSGLSLAVDAVADDPATPEDETVAAVAGEYKETTIAVYDSLGESHTPTIRFTRTSDPLVWNWEVTDPTTATGSGTMTFDSDGRYVDSTVNAGDPVVLIGSAGADNIEIDFDFSSMTMLSSETTIAPLNQDGLAAGSVSELYGAPNTGELYLVYSNGLKEKIGQIALAAFTNPSGLLRSGSNCYKIGLNSGDPQIGTANTGGRGAITSGYLEASNVDMAQEFTNMILAQRGFQASSRVISTSDQILQELVNLKQ